MKFCSKCGKELLDEAVICPGCGCPADTVKTVKTEPQDYKTILHRTKTFFIVGIVLLVLGIFAWIANGTLPVIYATIGEKILGHGTTMGMWNTCVLLANWSSVVFLFAAEFLFLLPKNRFNTAFKRENKDLLIKSKAEYKKAAQEKNREMNKKIPCYRICWIMAIVSFALFVLSIVVPGLGF